MKTTNIQEIEQLSAYLDGQLSGSDATRLQLRLETEPDLAAALENLRQVREILHKVPQHRVPRNFTLTRKMAGIKPPVPRSVPAFSWASAVAMLIFICTLGSSMVGKLSFGAAAPMMASAPQTAPQQESGLGGGPSATEAPSEKTNDIAVTATPEISAFTVAEPPPQADARTMGGDQEPSTSPFNAWLIVWPITAGLFLGAAILTRYLNIQTFRKKN